MYAYKRRKIFKPTPEQRDFFNWVDTGTGSCMLIAGPGTGKSTTLLHAVGRMEGGVIFCSYNKKIADELKVRTTEMRVDRPGVFIATLHSAGYSAWRKFAPRVGVDDRKSMLIMDRLLKDDPARWRQLPSIQTFVGKMVSFAKQFLVPLPRANDLVDNLPETDIRNWHTLMNHFSVDDELPDNVTPEVALNAARLVYSISHEECQIIIDFDDMLYAPLVHNARFYRNDWVLLDEAQDTNPARLQIVQRMLEGRNGRLVAVGDPFQSIYGFTGAMADSMQKIKERFDCITMPLSVTHRCPKAIVKFAQQWCGPDHLRSAESAPEGSLRDVSVNNKARTPKGLPIPWFVQDAPSSTSAILCRYTAPLVKTAYAMLREGIPCKIEGRDVGRSIINLMKRWKVVSLEALEDRLSKYLIREGQRARQEKSDKRLQDVSDRVETLRVFIQRARSRGERTIDGIEKDVNDMFVDNVEGVVTLSTGHKSKGREWPRVYWLCSAPRIRRMLKPWEAEQERNIEFVISTRPKEELVLVPETIHSPSMGENK